MQFLGDVPYQLLQGFTCQQDFWLNCAELSNIFTKVEYFANLKWLPLLLCTFTEKHMFVKFLDKPGCSMFQWLYHAWNYDMQHMEVKCLAFQGYVMEKWITRSTCAFAIFCCWWHLATLVRFGNFNKVSLKWYWRTRMRCTKINITIPEPQELNIPM